MLFNWGKMSFIQSQHYKLEGFISSTGKLTKQNLAGQDLVSEE